MTTSEKNATLTDKLLLASGIVLFAIGQAMNFIVVAPMARTSGLTELQFGTAFTIASLPLLFAAPFWGRRSDRIGRKPIFILGLLGSGLGTLMLALSLRGGMLGALTTTWLLVCLTASRTFYGLTSSAIYPAAAAYMADVTDFSNRAKGMAIVGSANSLGSILGPLLAASLAFAGVLMPMYAAAGLCIAGAFAAVCLLREPVTHAERRTGKSDLKFTDRRLRPYMIMWACFFLVFISLNLITAFYIEDRFGISDDKAVIRTASLALTSMAVVITVVQGVLLQMYHVSPHILLRLCAPAFAIGLLLMGFAPSPAFLMAGFAMVGLSFAFATPGINGSASLAVEPHEQGAAAGYLSAANSAGAILSPLVGTSIYQIAPNAPMLAGAAVFSALSIFALFIPAPRPIRVPA
jgi:MFS family permease